ncbi:OpgC domain-containing protein [Fibrobacter sp. UWP2]|uniref:OpgC domain-containing protein n=1 Tax=Fibrobacter sp. UWP2 TaxID=1896216 RepID=UPI000932C08A|nr:OpgC domain-containing protein [Fibrobacter sp. UWP2]
MRIRALDSIRGLLLLQMTLDHFGKPISHYLYQCFGFFSAAEGFFFLSGFVGMLAATSKSGKDPHQSWMRWRAFKTWRYHMATLAIVCIAAATLLPRISHFFDPLYQHPVTGSLWSLALVNTPEWLDVLPLYVLFLFIGSFVFPWFVRAKKLRTVFALWLPFLAIWGAAQFGLRGAINSLFPGWLTHGDFDPFAWQCVYFTGAAVAAWWTRAKTVPGCKATQIVERLTPTVMVALVFCFLWSHQFIPLALPGDLLTSKVHVGALRFANFFAFMMLVCWIVRTWPSALDFRPTNVMGRHSLDVYTAHNFVIYLWMALPGSIRYHGPWNVLAPVLACVALWGLARVREPKPAAK